LPDPDREKTSDERVTAHQERPGLDLDPAKIDE